VNPGHSERQKLQASRDQNQKLVLRAPWLKINRIQDKSKREKKLSTWWFCVLRAPRDIVYIGAGERFRVAWKHALFINNYLEEKTKSGS